MKYLKRFNEELKADTYKRAGTKLLHLGHKRRSSEMLDYASQREKIEQERKRKLEEWKKKLSQEKIRRNLRETEDELGRFKPFNLIIKGDYEMIGNFYILPNTDIYVFKDILTDFIHDKMEYQLSVPFEFGIMAADKETKEKFKNWNWSPEQYSGISWPNRLWLSTTSINSPCFDPWDKDDFYFSTRVDAMRFKKMFVDLLEGKIDWYDKRWNKNKSPIDELKQILSPRNISLKIDYIVTKYEERDDMEEADKIRELEKRIGEINYQNVINSAKNIKINSIYID
jgi:hypothetical protein